MSKVKIEGNANGSGTLTISAPNTNTDRSLTLPDNAGEILTDASTLSSSTLSGALPAIDGSNLTGVGKVLGYKRIFDNTGTNVTVSDTYTNIASADVSYTVVGDNSTFIYSVNLNKESDWSTYHDSAYRVKYSLNGGSATNLAYLYGDSALDSSGLTLTSINVMIPSSIGASAGDTLLVEVDFAQSTTESSYFNQQVYSTAVNSGDLKTNGYIMELA